MLSEKQKLGYIEGLRGMAAIIVVLHHYSLAFYPALNFGDISQTHIGNGSFEVLMARTPLNLIYNGGFAVCIFFIMSGYVLSNAYHRTNDPKVLTRYAIKRYFRLLVPVGVSIFIAYFIINAGLMYNAELAEATKTGDWLSGAFETNDGLFSVLKNVFFEVFFLKDNTYNPVLWTMTYELLGSFLIFAFLLITHPFKYKISLYSLLVLILFICDQNFYAAFILGVILNRLQFEFKWQSAPKWAFAFLFLIGLFFCSYPICIEPENTIYGYITLPFVINYEFFHVVGSFLVMCAVLYSEKMKHALSSNLLSYIGKISFSFYLLHFIILCSLSCYVFDVCYPAWNYHAAVLCSFLVSLPVLAFSSILYYRWVDRGGIILSEKILRFVASKTSRL